MKKQIIKKSFWQFLLSIIALAVFVFLATATFPGTKMQKRRLEDGRWELSKHYAQGNVETIRGNVDKDGLWEGPVSINYENDEYITTHTEEVTMKAGKRHGISKITYPGGKVETHCYQYGKRVEMDDCQEKSAGSPSIDNTAFSIFSYKVPWFAFKLDALGYNTEYVEAYMDTLEMVLYSNEFTIDEFDDYYDGAIEILEETAYDSIIQLNAELSLYNGIDLILSHEFRLATLYSFGKSDSNTYGVVITVYPNYLLYLNTGEVTDTDFEGFCQVYDSIMSSYEPIALDDPYLIDSLDERMYRTLEMIYNGDENSAAKSQNLKSALLSNNFCTIRALQRENNLPVRKQALNKTPQEVSAIVLYTILENYIYGDLIKNAVKEAFTINKSIVVIPTVITDFSGYNSSTSATIYGNVIEDGGGEVISRGIAWGKIYNPTINNQILSAGSGTGDFTTTLTDLTEGETYYVRAFATNSAGTAYGNCISFIAESTIGTDARNLSFLDLRLFPNPAMNNVTLFFNAEDSKGMVFTMFDLNGKVVLQKRLVSVVHGENFIRIDISEIESGIYSCRLEGNGKVLAMQNLTVTH